MLSINIFFSFCSISLILCATLVIFSHHSIFSLLFLVGSFLSASFILFLLECELLGLLFLIIYLGAISILFLFSIMMLEFKNINLSKNLTKYVPMGIFFGLILFYPLYNIIESSFSHLPNNNLKYSHYYLDWYNLIDSITECESLGQVLYSYFAPQFLIAGLILLVVILGVAHLVNNYKAGKVGYQVLFKQLSKNTVLK